ncbi:LysR family transcriptional regulator [Thiobacillus sp.]|uniref:LysR family transcriptional regulator n=1 Tax=Thiobacillus sp. TaxID=924 RepID=UPI0025D5297A|nr:LysR family transcriptional regulator [Thiobacillus sp.]
MSISEYRFACAVASSGSFTAAADACFVTQPTLSNGIARLEHEFGERIFVRTTRKVTLTPFGEYILPYLSEIVHAHETLKRQVRTFGTPEARAIHIGLSPLIDASLVARAIAPFHHKCPEIEIVLCEMNLASLEREFAEGRIDFLIEVGNVTKRSCQSIVLYREPLVFVPRGGMPQEKTAGHSVCLTDIAEETFVMAPNDACGLARATRELFRRHRCKLNEYAGETLSCQVLEEWAMLGIGAAILPGSKLAGLKSRALPITDKSGLDVDIPVTVTWSRKLAADPRVSEFIEHLQAASSLKPNGKKTRPGKKTRLKQTETDLPKPCEV